MLGKVLKKMKEAEAAASAAGGEEKDTDAPQQGFPQGNSSVSGGFHAKKPSSAGAERARSIGNRQHKPSKTK
ncbi:MAG: hypothetical protein COU33_01480 [Candidatus Magasanikbacteria bacterium CG10_big_fil_rev_8_21_14_0_10_43_6]|uniref:Uncharacterized protein n=1 Tax=Candidatus Magasanikbacteria bacterium CG10_big_fil_rev_8_21_14_0_10_43_6 TaxID=1974650 RepID=A0A2M6W1Q7_9BACT|nr:MAG: hypothetical protein COU33_01480 [Candidatus Magasanikbacteria bacterium CG10_big_fil_rev_8_21_14_0_10_43_6]